MAARGTMKPLSTILRALAGLAGIHGSGTKTRADRTKIETCRMAAPPQNAYPVVVIVSTPGSVVQPLPAIATRERTNTLRTMCVISENAPDTRPGTPIPGALLPPLRAGR